MATITTKLTTEFFNENPSVRFIDLIEDFRLDSYVDKKLALAFKKIYEKAKKLNIDWSKVR